MNAADQEGPEQPEEVIQRILVALDASAHSLAALQAAADLAARLDAEMLGLYVEDIRLLQLADHPLARELNFFTPGARAFDRQAAEQQQHAQARLARQTMQRLVDRARLRWSFRVVQGAVPQEVLAAAQEADLVVLGKTGWSGRRQLGSTTRLVIHQSSRPALILQTGVRLAAPVAVVYDGSDQAVRALRIAASLMRSGAGFLTAIILADQVETAREYQAAIARWLRGKNLKARFRWLVRPTRPGLERLLQSEPCGLLVLPVELPFFPGEGLADFLRERECPVLLVR